MANSIILEFSSEDRERIDNLIGGIDNLVELLKIRADQSNFLIENQFDKATDNTDKAAETNGEVADIAPTPVEEPTPTTEQVEEEEKPTEAENEAESMTEPEVVEETRTIELSELQQKVIELVRSGKKDKVQSIVNEYADRVSKIPEEKRVEVWDRLTELEG